MSNTYIISYDLSKPGRNYEKVTKTIRKYSSWAKLGGSAYVIKSEKSPVQIRDEIMKGLDSNDKIFVGKVNSPAAWYGMTDDVTDWLKDNLD